MPDKSKPPDLSINKGIELMLRRKKTEPIPKKGFGFKKAFSLFRHNYYFIIELR